jgi:hypothetical protein
MDGLYTLIVYVPYRMFHNISITVPYPISQKTIKLYWIHVYSTQQSNAKSKGPWCHQKFSISVSESGIALSLCASSFLDGLLFFFFVEYKIKFPEERKLYDWYWTVQKRTKIIFCKLPRFWMNHCYKKQIRIDTFMEYILSKQSEISHSVW